MIAKLAFDPPVVDLRTIEIALAEQYGLRGTYTQLHGERDLNHCLSCEDGRRFFVRVGTRSEPIIRAQMQAEALLHVLQTDPGCPVPRIVRTSAGEYLGALTGPAGVHPITVMTWCSGAPAAGQVRERLAASIGGAVGRLTRALRSFFHPGAAEFVAWDLRRMVVLDPEIRENLSAEVVRLVDPFLAWAESEMPTALADCRHQIIHGDSHMSNLLFDGEMVTGIVDFGDMVFGPVVQNLATTIASLQRIGAAKPMEDAVIRGHHARDPLTEDELDLLPALVGFRHVTALAFYDAVINSGASRPTYAGGARDRLLQLLPTILSPPVRRTVVSGSLLARRQRVTDPYRHIFYRDPPEFVRGEGVELFAKDGRSFLDVYNNVACVGHNHPRVVEAIVAQARKHTLNTRYLDETIVEYAERLTACFPEGLDAAIFTCTGSEANDLALRLCRQLTGKRGIIAFKSAYHGNTDILRRLTSGLDPELVTVPVPMTQEDLTSLEQACRYLVASGAGIAALIFDPIFMSSGLIIPAMGQLSEAARIVRSFGGLLLSDEVQSGFYRTGRNMWGYQLHGFTPDLATLGKPMGNGYPMGAVIYSSEMQPSVSTGNRYFNTFAGNPVAAAAGRAVLDVLQDEEIGAHVAYMNDILRDGLALQFDAFSGAGLGWSIDVGSAAAADEIVEHLFGHGILAGTAGPARDRIRIRPPLIFGPESAERLFSALKTSPI